MIQMNQLDFSYRKKKVFSDLNLTLTEGHVYGLLGKNGAGKSTLLKLMCGLLFPKCGKIDVMGYLRFYPICFLYLRKFIYLI